MTKHSSWFEFETIFHRKWYPPETGISRLIPGSNSCSRSTPLANLILFYFTYYLLCSFVERFHVDWPELICYLEIYQISLFNLFYLFYYFKILRYWGRIDKFLDFLFFSCILCKHHNKVVYVENLWYIHLRNEVQSSLKLAFILYFRNLKC